MVGGGQDRVGQGLPEDPHSSKKPETCTICFSKQPTQMHTNIMEI